MTVPSSAGRGAQVRELLLTAAADLVAEVGWRAVTTRGVAQRAGVSPGLVHYHFGSVQALLRQAVVTVMREMLAELPPLLSASASPDGALEGMLAALDDYSGRDARSLLFVEAYLASTRDEELRAQLGSLVEDVRADLAAWLAAQGTDAPEDTAAVLAAAVDGVMLHRALNPQLTSGLVAPVLGRLLGRADGTGTSDRSPR